MNTEEKVLLVEELWDSTATAPERVPVTDAERQLLDERWKVHEKSPKSTLTLEEFKARLETRETRD